MRKETEERIFRLLNKHIMENNFEFLWRLLNSIDYGAKEGRKENRTGGRGKNYNVLCRS
jgi:hypothetical protein